MSISSEICFNPAEAEEGFISKQKANLTYANLSFNPAEAEEGFISEQPQDGKVSFWGFNPAEAEEGFIRSLETELHEKFSGFNPAEAEEGFISRLRNKSGLAWYWFQSSRSRRRVYKLTLSKSYMKNKLSFNPAEAEEGFISGYDVTDKYTEIPVSIQPKPKKGL